MKYMYMNMDDIARPTNHQYRLNSDCFITSIAVTLGFPYEDVYNDLFDLARSKMLLPNDPYNVLPNYLKFYGFDYVQVASSIKDLESDSNLTVEELLDQEKDSTLLIVVRKHMFGYKCNTIYNDIRHPDGSTKYSDEMEQEILQSKVAYYFIAHRPITHEKRFEMTIDFRFYGRNAKVNKEEALKAFKFLDKRSSKLVDNISLRYGTNKAVLGIDKGGVEVNEQRCEVYLKGRFTVGTDLNKIEATSVHDMRFNAVIEASDGTFMYAENFRVKGIRTYTTKIRFKV